MIELKYTTQDRAKIEFLRLCKTKNYPVEVRIGSDMYACKVENETVETSKRVTFIFRRSGN